MILVGKAIHDLSDIWVHDYHDEYGVHYGTENRQHYTISDGVLKLTTVNEDPHEDHYFEVDAEGKTTSNGISFGAAKSNYVNSAFYSSADHEHPIIAVFWGEQYIWPSREVKDATGQHSRYVFVDYANDTRGMITGANRTRNVDPAGTSFNIYLDTHQTFNLYKCTYYFRTANWVSVANTDPKRPAQVVMYNDANDNAFINGFVTWEFDRDDEHNKLINVPITENTVVDSIINIQIKPNPTPFARTTTISLYDQYDQYRGMLTQRPTITYTINQKPDNIDFTTASLIFYENDNTNAEVCTTYGPMSWIGGTGWIYFRIVGTSDLGAKHIFGEYSNQGSDRIKVSSNITTTGTATFNPGTGIWTVPVTWPTNNGGSSSFSGTISIEKPAKASYKQDSTTVLKVSGITSSAGSSGGVRTDTISVSVIGAQANDPENLKYMGTPSSSCTYTQNGGSGEGAAVVTYAYSIDGTVDFATVTGDGIVIWDQNDTGSERTITVTVTCVQTGDYATVECTQESTSVSYKAEDGAYIKFYDSTSNSALVVSSYGPMSGAGGEGWVYFRIIGKNGNGTEYILDDSSKFTISSSSTACVLDLDTLAIADTSGIWKCKVIIAENPGSGDYIAGTLSADVTMASYESCAYSTIIVNGLSVKNDNTTAASSRTFNIKVEVTDGVSGSVPYTQSPGTSGLSIPNITYKYIFGGDYGTYMCENQKLSELPDGSQYTTENKFYWKENKSSSVRGGTADVVQITIVCDYLDKNGDNPTVTVLPQQNYDMSMDIPKDDVLLSITWDDVVFFKPDFSEALDQQEIPNTGGGNFPFTGGTKKFYYKIKGTAKYSVYDNTTHTTTTENRTVWFGTAPVYNGNIGNITFDETVPDEIKEYATYSASHNVSGDQIISIISAPALTSDAEEREIYGLKLTIKPTTSNQNLYWPVSKTLYTNKNVITLKQDNYSASTTTYEYALTWDSIRFSRNVNMSGYKENDATFDILYDTSLTLMYCTIHGSYVKYAVNGEDRTVVETTPVQMTDTMFQTTKGTTVTKHVSVSKASGTIGFSNIELTKDNPGVFTITVTGASDDNTTSSDKTGKMTLEISEDAAVSYGGVQSEETTFTNCLTINKKKAAVTEGSVIEWESVKFYNSANKELTKTDTVYADSVSGSATTYTIRFTVHGTKYKTINGVKDTSSGTAVVSDLDKNYFKCSVKNYQGVTSGNTASAYDSSTDIYSLAHGIINTGTSDHTALTVTIIYQGTTGNVTLTNTLKVSQGAAPQDVCTLAFYVNSDKDNAYTQVYEPAGINKGSTTSSNLSTSVSGYPEAMTIYFYSYLTTTVDGSSTKQESAPSSNDVVIDSTDTDYLYKFETTKNESSSSDYYTITNLCGRTLSLTVKGYSKTETYTTTWHTVVFGPALCTNSSNTIGSYGSSSVTDTIGATTATYTVTFQIKGTRKTYVDGVEEAGSSTTIYYSGSVEVTKKGGETGHTFSTETKSPSSTLCSTTYSVSASCSQNLSSSSDTSARTCGFNVKVPAGSSGSNSWEEADFSETNGIFILKQSGASWVPVINW